jgi:hypothetical protein
MTGGPAKSWLLRRWQLWFFLPAALLFSGAPAIAQPVPPDAEYFKARIDSAKLAVGNFKARIDSAVLAVGNSPRFKKLSPKYRQQLAEFVSGNMLFTLLHEMAHAAVDQMGLPVLGKEEDAADSFAATRLIRIGTEFSGQIVAEAVKGWFLADRRDQKEGDTVAYYDEHGLNQQRAYQIVCFVVGSNQEKYKQLAAETKLPKDRQDSCVGDYNKALRSWELVLKPHLRAPDQPKTEIKVVYGEAKGKFEVSRQISQAIRLLETVAENSANQMAWPAPFTLEMQTCGFPNAAWIASAQKITLCYELGTDFSELYRNYNAAPAKSRKRKSK